MTVAAVWILPPYPEHRLRNPGYHTKKDKPMANNHTWYFRQMDKQGRTLARIIWNGQKRMVLIAAAPNGIFATQKKEVAELLRSEGYMETTGEELRRNNEKIPEPDQINYDRDMKPKYMLFNPNYDAFEKI
jgi:hypothetical protein